jgi:formate hydrogenlyase subunit 3/multisubunit Na+/H+ antiporter MnhD subunit
MVSSTPDSVSDIILFVLAAIVILIAAWSIFSFIRAIFFFIFSQGKEEKIKKAWNSIRYMIIWIILTVALLYLFPFIFKVIGLENYEKYNAKNIFNKAWTILTNIFEIKDVIKDTQELNKYNGQLYYDFDNTTTKVNDYEL